jgi:NADH:ubiquinone oxidoreductase subunit F (NADH-binding)
MAKKEKCGKCAGCKKGTMCVGTWVNSKEDKAQDKKVQKGMTSAQKKAFAAGDKKMDAKNPSKAADKKMDAALAKKVKKTVSGKKK